MTTETYPWVTGKLHAFRYDPQAFGPVLDRFNVAAPEGLESVLALGKYEVAEKTERYTVYHDPQMDAPFLLVLAADSFTFLFYIRNDDALMHWKRAYSFSTPAGLLKAFLPEKPADIKMIQIPMNIGALGPYAANKKDAR